jgi:hypothetical protein
VTAEPSDEWTMLCPPGQMDAAEAAAEHMPENIREIIESPLAMDGKFILVNDSALARTWQRIAAAPFEFRDPPRPPVPYPVLNDPTGLIRLSGI